MVKLGQVIVSFLYKLLLYNYVIVEKVHFYYCYYYYWEFHCHREIYLKLKVSAKKKGQQLFEIQDVH